MTARKTPARLVSEFVSGMLGRMGFAGRVQATDSSEDSVSVRIDDAPEDLRTNRELQAAIALLAAQAVSNEMDARVRVNLDLEGGEESEREQFLGDLAAEVAELVARTGRRAVIEGLESPERRIVHTALMDSAGVKTHSEGGESNRYLLVEPGSR